MLQEKNVIYTFKGLLLFSKMISDQSYVFWSCCSDFIFFAGPLETKVGENIPLPERDLFWTVRSIVGEFDHHGLGFPLQKLILGKLQFDLCFEILSMVSGKKRS